MKKTLFAMFVAAALVFAFSVAAHALDSFCALETFDKGVSDAFSLPSGASVTETGGGKTVLELKGDMSTTWSQIGFTPVSGTLLAGCEFMQEVYAYADVLRIHNSTGGSEIARVWVENGNIKMQSGNAGITIGSYSKDDWVRIDIICDAATKRGKVFINGSERGSFGFIKPAAFDMGNILFFNRTDTVTYFDNVYAVPIGFEEAAVSFIERFWETADNSEMYSASGLGKAFEALGKIAASSDADELESAKADYEKFKYKLLTKDGAGDRTDELDAEGPVLVSELDFKLTGGGGANVLTLASDNGNILELSASETEGLRLVCGEDIRIADTLEPDKWYDLKLISDQKEKRACIILNGAAVFEADAALGSEKPSRVSVSGLDGFDGSCVIGGAVMVTGADDYSRTKDIMKAKTSAEFYGELYTDGEISELEEAVAVAENVRSDAEDVQTSLEKIRSIMYDVQMRMTDGECFLPAKTSYIKGLKGFGALEGSFTYLPGTDGAAVVFEPAESEGGVFCTLFVRNCSLYAKNTDGDIILCDALEPYGENALTAVLDTEKGIVKVFLNGELIENSDKIECNKLSDAISEVRVMPSEQGALTAVRGDYVMTAITEGDISDVSSMEDIEYLLRISELINSVNNASRSSIADLISDNEEALCKYGLGNDYISLNEIQKSNLCLKLLNRSYKTLGDIASELNTLTKSFLAESKKTSQSSGGGASRSDSFTVSMPKASEAAAYEKPVTSEEKDAEIYVFPFKDVAKDHWAYPHIERLNKKGIVNGVSDTAFEPELNIKREEFIKLTVSAFGIKPAAGASVFKDVAQDAWYTPYINAAYEAGIVTGDTDGFFGIGKDITREDMFTVIRRVLGLKGVQLSKSDIPSSYTDAEAVSEYAREAVGTLMSENIVNGMTEHTIEPKAAATRAMAAKLTDMLIEKGWDK